MSGIISDSTPSAGGADSASSEMDDVASWMQSIFASMEPTGEGTNADVLESVIQSTESKQSAVGLDARFLDSLRDVAARYQGHAFSLDPIGIEMVRGVLAMPLSKMGSDEARDRIARHVATMLCEDPAARKRLEILWNRLAEKP